MYRIVDILNYTKKSKTFILQIIKYVDFLTTVKQFLNKRGMVNQ